METVNSKLSAHVTATKCDRNALYSLTTPPATATHKPVPHFQLIEVIEQELAKHQLRISKEQFAVTADGMRMFGTLTLSSGQSDAAFALGVRAGNDKTMALSMVAGLRVFVCDNMAFSGDLITLRRKHTSGLDLRLEIEGAVNRATTKMLDLDNDVTRLKGFDLTNKTQFAKSLLVDAALKGVMPTRMIPSIWRTYENPPHEEFAPRNMWSLHNAFTEEFKHLKPHIAMEASIGLGELFRIGHGQRLTVN